MAGASITVKGLERTKARVKRIVPEIEKGLRDAIVEQARELVCRGSDRGSPRRSRGSSTKRNGEEPRITTPGAHRHRERRRRSAPAKTGTRSRPSDGTGKRSRGQKSVIQTSTECWSEELAGLAQYRLGHCLTRSLQTGASGFAMRLRVPSKRIRNQDPQEMNTMNGFAALQAAIYKALMGAPGLTAIVGTRIFDDVRRTKPRRRRRRSRGSRSANSRPSSTAPATSDLFDLEVIIHAWSRAPGRKECLEIVGQIYAALHRQTLPATSGYIVNMEFAGHDTAKEADGETYHATVRFTGLLQTS